MQRFSSQNQNIVKSEITCTDILKSYTQAEVLFREVPRWLHWLTTWLSKGRKLVGMSNHMGSILEHLFSKCRVYRDISPYQTHNISITHSWCYCDNLFRVYEVIDINRLMISPCRISRILHLRPFIALRPYPVLLPALPITAHLTRRTHCWIYCSD